MYFIRHKEQSTNSYVNQSFDGRPVYPPAVTKGEVLNCGSQLPHTSTLKINVFQSSRKESGLQLDSKN